MGQIKHFNNGKWTILTTGEEMSIYSGGTPDSYYIGPNLSNGVYTKVNPDGQIINLEASGSTGGYRVYTALLSQSGTSDPSTIVLEDTKGITGWTRTSIGFYKTLIPGVTPTNTMTGFGNWTGNAGTYTPISDQSTILGYYSVYVGVLGEIWIDVLDSTFVFTDLSTLMTTTSLPIDIKFY